MRDSAADSSRVAELPLQEKDPAKQLWSLWRRGERPDVDTFLAQAGVAAPDQVAAVLRIDQRERWQAGERVLAESYLARHPALRADADCAVDLIYNEYLLREQRGEAPTREEYLRRFPEFAALGPQIELHRAMAVSSVAASEPPTLVKAAAADGEPLDRPAVPGYEVLGELGRGGMGVVYQARQVSLRRLVALKVILAGAHADSEHLHRFRAEAEAVARLRHANFVQVYEHGISDGHPYLALEYVEGGTLEQKTAGVPQPPATAAQMVQTLATAMHHAHREGLIHRDLKPANVLLTMDGVLKITDFGLVKRLQSEPDATADQTQSGALVGTPTYMAPEQVAAERAAIGPATDVYALGVILYELTTGRPPFQADSLLEVLRQVREEEPLAPHRLRPGVPRDLETICLKCLQKEPGRRYASAAALADDLRRFLNHEPIQARPVGPAGRLSRWCRRNPVVAGLTAALALFLLAAAVSGIAAALRFAALAKQAEAEAEESRRRLVRQYVATGERLAEEGDFFSALAWLAEALDLDRGDPERERPHRIALHSLLRQAPQLLDVWLLTEVGAAGPPAASSDGGRLLLVDGAGRARVWEVDSHQPLSPPLEEAGAVRFAAFSPDGRRVLTANADHEAQVWDAETGRPVTAVLAVGSPTKVAVLTADGHRVVTVTPDGRARLWDGDTGKPLPGMDPSAATVWHVTFSPDGRLVATVGHDRAVRLWESATGRLTHRLDHPHNVWHASFSPDGRHLATAGAGAGEGGVRLWSTDTGELSGSVKSPPSIRISFSPDGKQYLTAGFYDVRLGSVAGGQDPVPLPHQSIVPLGGFSPDSACVYTAALDMSVRLWASPTGRPLTPPLRHGAQIWHLSFSSDGRRWRTASLDGVVRTWAVAGSGGPTRTMKHDGSVPRLALSPDGRRAVTGGRDAMARIWDPATGAELHVLRGHTGPILAVAFSADGRLVVTASADGTARVWDAETGREAGPQMTHGVGEGLLGLWVTFSRDGQYVATAGWAPQGWSEARVWDVKTGRPAGPPLVHPQAVKTPEFSPDGRRLLTAGDSGRGARVWNWEKGTVVFELGAENLMAFSAAYSPDGTRIVTGNLDNTARVWDAETGRPLTPPLSHGGGVIGHVAFSPDGGRVVAAGEGQTARVWDAATGKPLTPPLRHRNLVGSASFSADGRYIVTGTHEGGRVWDAVTGRLLTVPFLPGQGSGFGRAVLTPDNRHVVTTAHDEYIRVWDDVLTAGDESVEELLLRARLVAGLRVDADGSLVPLEPTALRDGWAALRSRREGRGHE